MQKMGRKYSEEFKRDALRLCEREGVKDVSEKLGVPQKALYTWRREERLERGEAPKGLRPGETTEQGFKRLERENEELREANYILKKAMGFMVGR
jgi:transposase